MLGSIGTYLGKSVAYITMSPRKDDCIPGLNKNKRQHHRLEQVTLGDLWEGELQPWRELEEKESISGSLTDQPFNADGIGISPPKETPGPPKNVSHRHLKT